MKSHLLYQPTRSRIETAVFAGLGLVALFTVLLALFSMSSFVQGKEKVVATLSGGSGAGSRSSSGAGYISSGRLIADTKTLIAMARWILEPDVAMTKVAMVPSKAAATSAAISTNSSGVTPKA